MIGNLVIFGIATLLGKVVLGLAAVWALLPDDGRCAGCDAETFPLQNPPALRLTYRLLRVHLRWCPACDDLHHARRVMRAPPPLVATVRQPVRAL